jgi:hypothetical protein
MTAAFQETRMSDYLFCLEQQRDRLQARLEKINQEPAGPTVEGFVYVALDGLTGEQRARKVRGRLLCSILRRIDEVNREICRLIAPGFRPSPGEGYSDRVERRPSVQVRQ